MSAAKQDTRDRYSWWRNALKGVDQEIHEDQPNCGFYRSRRKDGGFDPVAIWWDRDTYKALRAGQRADAYALWTWVCRNPVSEAEYRKVADQGGEWSDAPPPLAVAGHNLPEDPAERLRILLREEQQTWKAWIGQGPIADEDRAAAAAALVKRWSETGDEAEKTRVKLKKPHDDAAKAVQQTWKPIVDGFAVLVSQGKRACDDFLREKAAAAREEARQQALAAAAGAAPAPVVEKARVGNTGQAITLRTYYSGQITDMEAFLIGQQTHPDIVEAAQKVANAIARGKATVPGMKIVTEERAA